MVVVSSMSEGVVGVHANDDGAHVEVDSHVDADVCLSASRAMTPLFFSSPEIHVSILQISVAHLFYMQSALL